MTRKSSSKGTHAFMPPEALHIPPKYDEKLDVFSYGNVIVTTVIHDWPEPGPPTAFERGKIIGFSELQRRQQYLVLFTPKENELFLPIVRPCLQNDPTMRPTSIQLVTQMRGIEESHPRRVEDSTVITQSCEDLRLKDEQLREKDLQLRRNHEKMQKILEESGQQWEEIKVLQTERGQHLQEIASFRKDQEAIRKDRDRHLQEVERLRHHLHVLQEENDRLRSKSSPVSQVGIGRGIMFVDLCT